MAVAAARACSRWASFGRPIAISLGVFLLTLPPTFGQPNLTPALRLDGVLPGGARNSATESWGSFDFEVTNPTEIDRLARVLLFFEGQPDVQYGRDAWVPAHSTMATWMLVGPAAPQQAMVSRGIQMLLYDRTAGEDRLILPPSQERVRSRGVLYRKREPSTVVLLDEPGPEQPTFGRLPAPDTPAVEAVRLVRTFRHAAKLSELVPIVTAAQLPPNPEAFDGIDHFVLASSRIADDPGGMRALRQWLERGGKVWVMLDRVDPEVVAPLLGDTLDFQLVDRVSLASFRIEAHPTGFRIAPPAQEHERPVAFARVLLPRLEQVRHTINGWPVRFTRSVGQGKIVFTTLGPRGWYRPRTNGDPASSYDRYPDLPMPTPPLEILAEDLHLPSEQDPFRAELFQDSLIEAIGYSVLSRETLGLVFGGMLVGALLLGVVLMKAGRPKWLGWLAPAAAVGVGVAFVVAGEASRRVAAPTVAVAQIVEAFAGKEEAAVHGLLAAYRPDSGPAIIGAERGGQFDLDLTGIEGQARRHLQTDMDAWHWENLDLPAGLRFASFRYSAATGEPITAVARLGPDGLEGRLATGPFQEITDALLTMPAGRNLAIRIQPDGAFSAGRPDILPPGQFLADAVLGDQQQRRQELYREFLRRPRSERGDGRAVLLAWAKPIDMHFNLVPDGPTIGTALLVVPLQLERCRPGERITIPGPLLGLRRVLPGGLGRPVQQSVSAADQRLRFQLPAAALPLKIERARLVAKIDAPSRRITVSGHGDGGPVELFQVDSPLDLVRVDITNERLLRLDEGGGLHLNLTIGELLQADGAPEKWRIEFVELEIAGQAK